MDLVDTLDIVHGLSGHLPWTQWTVWTMSMDTLDKVQWVHGQSPLRPARLDNVHGFSGHCPWTQWTLSRDSVDSLAYQEPKYPGPPPPITKWSVPNSFEYFLIFVHNLGKSSFQLCILCSYFTIRRVSTHAYSCVIIITLFQEDNISGTNANLSYVGSMTKISSHFLHWVLVWAVNSYT